MFLPQVEGMSWLEFFNKDSEKCYKKVGLVSYNKWMRVVDTMETQGHVYAGKGTFVPLKRISLKS